MSYVSLKLSMYKTKPSQDMFLPLGSFRGYGTTVHTVPYQKVGPALNISLPQYASHLCFPGSLPPAFYHPVFLWLLSQAPLSATSLTYPIGPPGFPPCLLCILKADPFFRTSSCSQSLWDRPLQQVGARL